MQFLADLNETFSVKNYYDIFCHRFLWAFRLAARETLRLAVPVLTSSCAFVQLQIVQWTRRNELRIVCKLALMYSIPGKEQMLLNKFQQKFQKGFDFTWEICFV